MLILAILSIYLGIRKLTENEQQSEAQIKILKQNDIGAANDKQAAYLLEELGRKFDEQNLMLKEILLFRGILQTFHHHKDE